MADTKKNLYLVRQDGTQMDNLSIMAGPFCENEKEKQIKEALIYIMNDAGFGRKKTMEFIERHKDKNGEILGKDVTETYHTVFLLDSGCSIVYPSGNTDSVTLVSYEPKSLVKEEIKEER